jgi:hypothetical protein
LNSEPYHRLISIIKISFKISIFANFATTGNPNVPHLGENVDWKPVNSTELPLRALNIKLDSNEVIDLPESERLQVWSEIYKKENVPLY